MAVALCAAAAAYLALLASTSQSTPQFFRQFLLHLGLATAAFVAAAALFAQFVLPVQKTEARRFVVGRLLNYMLGERGPVVLVQEGQPIESPREWDQAGPGVLLLDHVSAAVLRTDVQFTRTVGPSSVTFTEAGERLAESLDLRRQHRRLQGSPPPTGEPADLDEVSSRAVTRDGIPISATLEVTFGLARRAPMGRNTRTDPPPFEMAEGAVQRAVYGRVVLDSQAISWSELPIRLVVDLWREQVKARSLNELLDSEFPEGSALQLMEAAILAELGRKDGQAAGQETRASSATSPGARLLEDRGIRILDVRIPEIYLPEEIQSERLHTWYETWAGPVRRDLADAESQTRQAQRRGRAEAAAALARSLTRKLNQALRWHEPLSQRDSLILVLEDALEYCSRDPKLASSLSSLRGALEQVKSRGSDCRERGAEGYEA